MRRDDTRQCRKQKNNNNNGKVAAVADEERPETRFLSVGNWVGQLEKKKRERKRRVVREEGGRTNCHWLNFNLCHVERWHSQVKKKLNSKKS